MTEQVEAWIAEFERTRKSIDAALAQLSDDQFRTRLTPATNSCALIVKHLAGTCARDGRTGSPPTARSPTATAMGSSRMTVRAGPN
jgi:hypothetical protein